MSSPTSPNKDGIHEVPSPDTIVPNLSPTDISLSSSKPDTHFILTLKPSHEFRHTIDGREFRDVQPVGCMRVEYDVWRASPERKFGSRRRLLSNGLNVASLREVLRWWGGDIWLGRRVNDEVEMFEEGMKEQYTTLRHDLRALGLTVKPFIPAPEHTNKFPQPSYKAMLGADTDNENTLLARSLRSVTTYIANQAATSGKAMEYGLLGSVPGTSKPLLAIIRVPEDMKDVDVVNRASPYGGTMEIEVVGRIRDGVPSFDDAVGEDVAKGFFDSLGRIHQRDNVVAFDRATEIEQDKREEAKVQKREAKRARRRVTLSVSVSSVGVGSEGAGVEEDEEAVKARQKVKAKEKRKAQNAKKREAREAEERKLKESGKLVAQCVVELSRAQQKEDEEEKKMKKHATSHRTIEPEKCANDEDELTFYRLPDHTDVDENELYLVLPSAQQEENNQEPEKLGLGGEESPSSSETDDGEENRDIEVVVAKTHEEIQRAIRARPNSRIAIASQEDFAPALGIHL